MSEREPPVVVVVEDNRGLADLYAQYLADAYTVRVAHTGEEALSHLDEDVDVALLDRRLDAWTGDELVTVIHERSIDCQIAMITGVDPYLDMAGMAIDDYLTKPVSREDLRGTVDRLLRWARNDADTRELLALMSRRATLEQQKSRSELRRNDEYEKLRQRIEKAKNRLDLDEREIGRISSKYRPKECPECGLRWDLSVGDASGFEKLGAYAWRCDRCGNVEALSGPSDRRVARR